MIDPVILSLQLYGLAIVISLLVALLVKLIVAGLQVLVHSPTGRSAQDAASAETAIPGAHVAAIAGALAEVMGEHRIVRISDRPQADGWAYEGRAAHHQSHNIARQRKR